MKRLLTIGLVLASAFALTNCTEQLVAPVEENDVTVDQIIDSGVQSEVVETIPYEVSVENAETKTAYDSDKGYISWIKNTDKIVLYNKKSTDGATTYSRHGAFTYAGGGRFAGDLVNPSTSLADLNNWYCIYPFNSSSAGTNGKDIIQETVTIGAKANADGKYVQSQDEANSQRHLAGEGCPLYGIKNKVHRDKTPKFQMSHLYSVVALNIVNEGDGDASNGNKPLNINAISLQAPESIVGEFVVNISGDEPVYVASSGKSSPIATLDLSQESLNYISIPSGGSATIYLAVKPFDASNKEITLIVNGSPKTVRMPANFKFEAGRITTLKVPITHTGSKVTDAFEKYGVSITNWWGTQFVNFGSFGKATDAIINGEDVKIYTLGTEHGAGTLTLKGKAHELIQLLPAYFYAGSWGDRRTAMRLSRVKMSVLGIGIDYTYDKLIGLVDPTMITFDGLLSLDPESQQNITGNIIITDEEPYHKKVDEAAVEKLLAKFDTSPNNPNDNMRPTFNGLKYCLMNPTKIDQNQEAKTTIDIIFSKAKSALASRDGYDSLVSLLDMGPATLLSALKLVDVTVEISTVATTAGEVTSDGTLKDSRVVVWGMDVTSF